VSPRAALVTLAIVACTSYGSASARSRAQLGFGIDPGIAGSVGASQQAAVPDQPTRDLRALRRLRPGGKALVLRLGRLFSSDGTSDSSDSASPTRTGFPTMRRSSATVG